MSVEHAARYPVDAHRAPYKAQAAVKCGMKGCPRRSSPRSIARDSGERARIRLHRHILEIIEYQARRADGIPEALVGRGTVRPFGFSS